MPPRSKDPQPSFDFGFEPEPAETLGFAPPTDVGPSDTFFFAIRPSPMAAVRIDAMSQALISTPAWQGGHRVGLAHLHASLHALDRKAGALHDVLAAGCRAVAGLELKAFPVRFDALFSSRTVPSSCAAATASRRSWTCIGHWALRCGLPGFRSAWAAHRTSA